MFELVGQSWSPVPSKHSTKFRPVLSVVGGGLLSLVGLSVSVLEEDTGEWDSVTLMFCVRLLCANENIVASESLDASFGWDMASEALSLKLEVGGGLRAYIARALGYKYFTGWWHKDVSRISDSSSSGPVGSKDSTNMVYVVGAFNLTSVLEAHIPIDQANSKNWASDSY